MKIVQLDGYAANPGDLSIKAIEQLGELTIYPRTAAEQVVERAKDAEAILVNKVKITEEVLAQLPRLRYIGVLATGYNVVDVDAAHRRNITVTNIPSYSTDSVAQHTFALLLAVTNRVEHYAALNRNGRWSQNPDFCYWDEPIVELAGKTMGIVGLGNIGMRVAMIAKQFGMDVFAVTSKHAIDLPEGIQKTTMQGLFGVSDVISLHCPLTDETQHLVSRSMLDGVKSGAIILNTARGALVDEQAVADALNTGRLAAYAADVLEQEPPLADNPLLTAPRAYITPHVAWAGSATRQRLMDICAENLKAFIEGHPQNIV